tara:strand:+ start:21120 stop:21476 length:357 start_codon:yes stop_codon:yes gene_type:complete
MLSFKEYLKEALTPQQRIARSRAMKRMMPKIMMKRKLAMRKKASPEQLKKRAIKQATDVIRKKIAKGTDYNSMSMAAKGQLDKKVEKKKAVIKKIAKKLIPKIKKAEAERLAKLKEKP